MKNIEKNMFFEKNQKLTTNYWHLLKSKLNLYMYGENSIQDANILGTKAP